VALDAFKAEAERREEKSPREKKDR
jgi:hypothetical protein